VSAEARKGAMMEQPNVSFAIEWNYSSDAALGSGAEVIKRTIFNAAANRWSNVIEGWPLPASASFEGLRINVEFKHFRAHRDAAARVEPSSMKFMDRVKGVGIRFPKEGTIAIDLADTASLLVRRADFLDVVTHEIGHVLGIGMLLKELEGSGGSLVEQRDGGWRYVGPEALKEYSQLLGRSSDGVPILIEDSGTAPTFHWDDEYLEWDLMSAELKAPELGGASGTGLNAISRVTIGALADLGYNVKMENAEYFALLPQRGTRPSTSRCYTGAAED